MAAETDYVHDIEAARSERVARLTKPDGWLTLIGLHFLNPGDNTVGHDAGNSLVLAAGPARLGTVSLSAAGVVTFAAAPDVEVRIDGEPVRAADLRPAEGEDRPSLVSAGTVSFFVIERGGRKALRVRDSAAPRRTAFVGLDYFPTDPSWRIEGAWVAFDPAREIPITNILGHTANEPVPGKVVFQREGRTFELWPVSEGADEPLFFIFADATSGEQTYGMRFLDAAWPVDGKVVLDFNLATNPPCAFTPFATCPLPPPENRLPIAVTAGEKNYRGAHE